MRHSRGQVRMAVGMGMACMVRPVIMPMFMGMPGMVAVRNRIFHCLLARSLLEDIPVASTRDFSNIEVRGPGGSGADPVALYGGNPSASKHRTMSGRGATPERPPPSGAKGRFRA
jgi:hypothetical protein